MMVTERAQAVRTREDFVAFLDELTKNFVQHQDEWENADLARFLEALAAWVADMDGFYANRGETVDAVPPWRVIAQALSAARFYE